MNVNVNILRILFTIEEGFCFGRFFFDKVKEIFIPMLKIFFKSGIVLNFMKHIFGLCGNKDCFTFQHCNSGESQWNLQVIYCQVLLAKFFFLNNMIEVYFPFGKMCVFCNFD